MMVIRGLIPYIQVMKSHVQAGGRVLVLAAAVLLAPGCGGDDDTTGPGPDPVIGFAPLVQGQTLVIGDSRQFSTTVQPEGALAVVWRRGGTVVGDQREYLYAAQHVGRDTLRVRAEAGTVNREFYWVVDVEAAPSTVPPLVPGVGVAPGPEPTEVVVTWTRVAGATYPIVAYEIVMSYAGIVTTENWSQAIHLGETAHVSGQSGYSATFSRANGNLTPGAEAWFAVRARDDRGQLSGTLVSRETRITTEWWIDGRVLDDLGQPILGVITATTAPIHNDNSDGEGLFRLGPYRSVDTVTVATIPPTGYYAFRTGKITSTGDISLDIVLPQRYELAPECTFASYGGNYLNWFRQMTRTATVAGDSAASRLWKWEHWPVTVFLPDSTLATGRDMDQAAREMMELWNQSLGREFLVETTSWATANIYFAWVDDASGGYGQASLELPAGGVLGDVRPVRVRVELETGIQADQFFREVCLHELGHALGLAAHSLECDGAGHLMVLGAAGNLSLEHPIHPDEVRAVRLLRVLPQGVDMRSFTP
ncbi:MAG: hypothetical protein IPK64_08655 [bacterium]|nr:hypothetical protein [bacterium]